MAKGQQYKPFSDWTKERKENHIKYDQQNYSVIGSKLTREKADLFRQLCKDSGVSVSSAISQFVQACIIEGRIIDFSQDMSNGKSHQEFQDIRPDQPENDTPGTVKTPKSPSE